MHRYLVIIVFLWALAALPSCNGCGNNKVAPVKPSVLADTVRTIHTPVSDSLSKLIAAQPGKVDLYIARYKEYMKSTSYDAAMKDVVKAIELDPKNPEYYIAESDVYFAKRDLVRAINALEQGNSAVPDNVPILLTLGRYYFFKNDNLKALASFNHVLKLDAGNADAYFWRGELYKETGDTTKAIADYQSTVEHDPKYADAYMELGILKAAKKDGIAVDYYNNVLKLDSGNVLAKYNIALFYQNKKDYKKAIPLYRSLVIDTPQYELPYYNLGYIYFQLDSLQKADRQFEIATSVKPTYADAYYMRGLIAEARGDNKKAYYFYSQTLKLDAKNKGAIEGFGRLRNEKK